LLETINSRYLQAVLRADVTELTLLPWMWLRSALQTYGCWLLEVT
jgi:hypothetical protein